MIAVYAQNRIVSMITKLGEHEYGIKKEPAVYDDHDNESQQYASALAFEQAFRRDAAIVLSTGTPSPWLLIPHEL